MISLIAIIGKNRELGKNNRLIWHIPEDLMRFRRITSGHPVIMGRKTFESIGRPLPGRSNIVVSANKSFTPSGVTVVRSVEEAVGKASESAGSDEIFVIGGGSLYNQTMNIADRLYLTIVDAEAPADAFFPDYSSFGTIKFKEDHPEHSPAYSYVTVEK